MKITNVYREIILGLITVVSSSELIAEPNDLRMRGDLVENYLIKLDEVWSNETVSSRPWASNVPNVTKALNQFLKSHSEESMAALGEDALYLYVVERISEINRNEVALQHLISNVIEKRNDIDHEKILTPIYDDGPRRVQDFMSIMFTPDLDGISYDDYEFLDSLKFGMNMSAPLLAQRISNEYGKISREDIRDGNFELNDEEKAEFESRVQDVYYEIYARRILREKEAKILEEAKGYPEMQREE